MTTAFSFYEAESELSDQNLESLQVAACGRTIPREELEKFSKALASHSSLTYLFLLECPITETDFPLLTNAIAANTSITKDLIISQSQLSYAHMQHLASALKIKKSLKSLSLYRDQISDNGLIEVLNASQHLKLTELTFFENNLCDVSAQVIAKRIEEINTLKSVCLDSNQITDIGAIQILKATALNKNMQYLRLSHNQLTEVSIKSLIHILPKFKDHDLAICLKGIHISPVFELELRKQLKEYPNLLIATDRFPHEFRFKPELKDIENCDVTGRPIMLNTSPLLKEEKLALETLHRWRQMNRAHRMHRKSVLFGKNAGDSLQNHVDLPPAFKYLQANKILPLFTHVTHHSDHVLQILHDGALYSKFQVNYRGVGNIEDANRLDELLVFTSPFSIYASSNNIRFSAERLFETNSPDGVYFRFFDLSFSKAEYSAQVSDNVILKVKLVLSNFVFSFYDKENNLISEIEVSGERLVYHGLKGLHEYFTFFIFYLLEHFNHEHAYIRDQIYNYFQDLNKKGLLAIHLNTIAKSLIKGSEVNYINSLKINFMSIDQVTYKNEHFDFTLLRQFIQQNNVAGFEEKFILNSVFFDHLTKCAPLIKGIIDYAELHNANDIIRSLHETCDSDYQGYYQVLESETGTDPLIQDLIYAYNNYYSRAYADAKLTPEEAQMIVDGKVVYRPNHGLVHHERQIVYLKHILNYFAKHASDPDFRAYCKNITPSELLKLSRIAMFLTVGRESEINFATSFSSDQFYHSRSAEQFSSTAKIRYWMKPMEIFHAKTIIRHLGNPNYPKCFPTNDLSFNFAFYVLKLAHRLDLMRCEDKTKFMKGINELNNLTVIESSEQKADLKNLFKIVYNAIILTGDRHFCYYKDSEIIDGRKDYGRPLFYKASTNVIFSMKTLKSLDPEIDKSGVSCNNSNQI